MSKPSERRLDAERLRLAAALAHAVPDGELLVRYHDGDLQHISYQDRADMSPCQWRAALLELLSQGALVDVEVDHLRLGGAFSALTAGLFMRRDESTGEDECWFATTLHPGDVQVALRECDVPIDPDLITVSIKPDCCLGVCAVRLRIDDPRQRRRLPEVGFVAHNACLVEELVHIANHAGERRGENTN